MRVSFYGIVTEGRKKKKMRDHVDIHVGSVNPVKAMFQGWLSRSAGIRGDSGVFHPLGKDGKIVIIYIKKL